MFTPLGALQILSRLERPVILFASLGTHTDAAVELGTARFVADAEMVAAVTALCGCRCCIWLGAGSQQDKAGKKGECFHDFSLVM